MMHFRELDGSYKSDCDPDALAQRILHMNKVIKYCADNVRYNMQRNLLQDLETLCRRSPSSLAHRKAFRDVVETVVESYHGRGQVHLALKRAASEDDPDETRENNIWRFDRLPSVFQRHAEANSFLVERMMAKRCADDDAISLTVWGQFVLEHLEKEQGKSHQAKNVHYLAP